MTSPANKIDRRLAAGGLFSIAVYFFRLTRPALRAGFSPDDCMNLYRGWFFPLRSLINANLLFFLASDFIRPMGEAWYRAIYFFAGFRAAPFHAVDFGFMLLVIFLIYSLARRLADSRFAALAAALLFAYQERWAPLYFDTAYIFDVLCGFFLFAALLLYIRVRQQGRAPRIPEYAALAALFVCALNSKEMAVVLPALVALYELVYGPGIGRGGHLGCAYPRANPAPAERAYYLTNPRRRFFTAAAMAVMAAAFIAGRTGTLTANEAYKPQFTAERFLATTTHFLDQVFGASWFEGTGFTGAAALALAAALLLAAIALHSKPALFAWGFTALAALPLAFVPPRGAPQYYIPLFGCALYAASLIALAAQRMVRAAAGVTRARLLPPFVARATQRVRHARLLPSFVARAAALAAQRVARAVGGVTRARPLSFFVARAAAGAALLAIAWPIYSNGKYVALRDVTSITIESPVVMALAARMRRLHPTFPRGARVLFMNDPIPPNVEDLLFIVRLAYRDRTIEVERVSRTHSPPTARQRQAYDAVFDYGVAGLTEIPQPPLALEPRILKFFDADWRPVTAAAAAKPGSRIIALASDLGPTSPEVTAGNPFPRDPQAAVLARIDVTADGVPAPVVNRLGQPGEVNVYRFDFILPRSAKPGLAKIKISAAGYLSPAAEIPVAR